MSKKLVVSECCNASVQHFPVTGDVFFFCNKCNEVCKTKIIKEEKEDKKNK